MAQLVAHQPAACRYGDPSSNISKGKNYSDLKFLILSTGQIGVTKLSKPSGQV